MYDITALGRQIKAHRRQMGLTQRELAAMLMVSFQAVSNWENSITLPDIDNLCRLATIFRMSLDSLLQSE